MSPSARPPSKRTGTIDRQVKAKVSTRFASSSVNLEDQVLQFREARRLREKARLENLRSCRLKNSSAVGLNVAASISITTTSATGSRNASAQLPAAPKASSSNSSRLKFETCTTQSHSIQQSRAKACPSKTAAPKSLSNAAQLLSSKLRRSLGGKKTSLKSRLRKIPKAEVKLTKAVQLRMLKNDPLLELSHFSTSSRQMVLPLPVPLPKLCLGVRTEDIADGTEVMPPKGVEPVEEEQKPESCIKPKSSLKKVSEATTSKLQSPSRIPVRKTSFVSPMKRTPLTPGPSPLRERLAEWLEKRNHSLDNFKHLKCFGVLGPVVKRPQTPFRKTILSTSTLRAIPESTESTPNKETFEDSSDDSAGELNATFTLEEEDKENICHAEQRDQRAVIHHVTETQDAKELDQAHGVLSELHKLIQMGYPVEQCGLWLRAVRRRFPQCGDEAIYWECLASLEEARGDLQTAVACYERAILQGAELIQLSNSVQHSLDLLLKKMSDLHIEPVLDASRSKSTKLLENQLLDSSNIINSSSIQFAVHEKCASSKKSETQNEAADTLFTATPVRRSTRLAGTPKKGTPGVTCVRSLEFLEPSVRESLVFQNNSALDPRD